MRSVPPDAHAGVGPGSGVSWSSQHRRPLWCFATPRRRHPRCTNSTLRRRVGRPHLRTPRGAPCAETVPRGARIARPQLIRTSVSRRVVARRSWRQSCTAVESWRGRVLEGSIAGVGPRRVSGRCEVGRSAPPVGPVETRSDCSMRPPSGLLRPRRASVRVQAPSRDRGLRGRVVRKGPRWRV